MAFLHENPEAIEMGKSEKSEAAQQKLDAFRKKVKAQKHVKYWADAVEGRDELREFHEDPSSRRPGS
jgi:hypothetical protein